MYMDINDKDTNRRCTVVQTRGIGSTDGGGGNLCSRLWVCERYISPGQNIPRTGGKGRGRRGGGRGGVGGGVVGGGC